MYFYQGIFSKASHFYTCGHLPEHIVYAGKREPWFQQEQPHHHGEDEHSVDPEHNSLPKTINRKCNWKQLLGG